MSSLTYDYLYGIISPMENNLILDEDTSPMDLEKAPMMDIRQKTVWDAYISPKSKTFGNAYQSALASGYADSYARVITQKQWWQIRLVRLNMLPRAERALKRALLMKTTDRDGNEQADLLRIQTDVAKHITKTLGKDEGYSERSEITGKDGSPIVFMPAELIEKYSIPVESEDVTNKQYDVSKNSNQEQEEGNVSSD